MCFESSAIGLLATRNPATDVSFVVLAETQVCGSLRPRYLDVFLQSVTVGGVCRQCALASDSLDDEQRSDHLYNPGPSVCSKLGVEKS